MGCAYVNEILKYMYTLVRQSMLSAEDTTFSQSTGDFCKKENKLALKTLHGKEKQILTTSGQTSVGTCLSQVRVKLLLYK